MRSTIWGNAGALAAALALYILPASGPAAAEDGYQKGRVTDAATRRLARPSTPALAADKPLEAQVQLDGFKASVNGDQLQTDASADGWNPWRQEERQPERSLVDLNANSRPLQGEAATLDYGAIEKAYATAIPPAAAPLAAAINTGSLAQAAAVINGLSSGALNFGNYANIGGAMVPNLVRTPGVALDTDYCDCHMVMPSQSCMNARTSQIYGAHYGPHGFHRR